LDAYPVGKMAQKQSKGERFLLIRHSNTVPNYQQYTPTDCFFGDWVVPVLGEIPPGKFLTRKIYAQRKF